MTPAWGAEIDIRSKDRETLYLAHDPFVPGDDLDLWLTEFKRREIKGPLILNTKEDGLESACLERLNAHKIDNFFFLDTTIPSLAKWTMVKNQRQFAVRFSRYEPLSAVMAFAGKATWVWVDCFNGLPPNPRDLAELKSAFRLCLVSPELQVGWSPDLSKKIEAFLPLCAMIDAICTKSPELWSAAREPSRAS